MRQAPEAAPQHGCLYNFRQIIHSPALSFRNSLATFWFAVPAGGAVVVKSPQSRSHADDVTGITSGWLIHKV
jgi:hypothetical protein